MTNLDETGPTGETGPTRVYIHIYLWKSIDIGPFKLNIKENKH